jgi:hypothetical protein
MLYWWWRVAWEPRLCGDWTGWAGWKLSIIAGYSEQRSYGLLDLARKWHCRIHHLNHRFEIFGFHTVATEESVKLRAIAFRQLGGLGDAAAGHL